MKDEFGKKVYKNRKEFFKEYALCSCLTQVSLSDSIGSKEASRSVYYDLSDDELMISNTGKKIDSNTLSYLDKRKNATGVTYENRKAPVFDCITYYRSKERSKFIAGLVASLRRNKK